MLRSIYKPGAASSGASAQPHPLSRTLDEHDEESENDSMGDLPTPMGPPRAQRQRRRTQDHGEASADSSYSALSASDCFEEALEVDIEGQGTWRVYRTQPKRSKQTDRATTTTTHHAPNISGNTTGDASLSSLDIAEVPSDDEEEDASPGTMFLFHHGAGFSGLSFALTAREITHLTNGQIGVMAIDCRGHGRTTHDPSKIPLPYDMSLTRLVSDVVCILEKLYSNRTLPTLVLVGHSMGGSVVVSLTDTLQKHPTLHAKIAGVVVLDVVEGTAMDALSGMRSIVQNQPKGFSSVQEAIKWHLDSGAIQNLDSARISVPSLLLENNDYSGTTHAEQDEPMEELQEEVPHSTPLTSNTSHRYIWRADLLATEPYWSTWFKGLSQRFLTAKTARLLLLAGTDRLDKDLMVGQMQGKYQLAVFPDVGHSLQEDAPEKTARLLVEFWRRNEVVPGKLNLNKVGDR